MEIKHLIVGPLLTNCYILISKDESAIIDPGGGTKRILKEIEESKTKLKYIILTHSHWDHAFSALKIKNETEAKILMHKEEKELVSFKIDNLLEEGEEIKIGNNILKVIHTPGHTKGSICLLGTPPTHRPPVRHGERAPNFIFTGDTIFKDGYGRTDLPGGSKEDLKKSLGKLEKILKPGMKVYPGHGEIFEYKTN